jgi:glycosyltransferase involved in cell wall biosynthesis
MAPALSISVVVCTYNGEAYLAEQLRTLLVQNRLPDEVVIGDDASSDGTWAIVEAFSAMARTRGVAINGVRRTERLGYVANFSRTLALASGDIVFLCDQDDAWHPDKIAMVEQRFRDDASLTLVHTDARLVSADGADLGHSLFDALELTLTERHRVASTRALEVYLRRNIATGATTAFRRDLLSRALPIPDSWIHDAWLAAFAAATGKVGLIDDSLIDYRQHDNNQIGMRRRTLKDRLQEFRLPRGDELRATAVRLEALGDRLTADGTTAQVNDVLDMRTHVLRRIRIGDRALLWRLPGIVREWITGGYTRFATGTRSAVRDLLRKG